MNGAASFDRGWSPSRWVAVVLGLFLFQAFLAWRLSDRSPIPVREVSHRLDVRLVPPTMSPDLAALLALNSPTMFVLPSREGFSGGAWLEIKPFQHRSPGWSNPPQWLVLKGDDLLADLARFGATNQPERASVSDRLSRPQQVRAPLTPEFQLRPGTQVTISGEVGSGDLITMAVFPEVEYAGLLAPTVVSILVDQRGRVFQASLAPGGSSGLPAADQLALERVRALAFTVDPRIAPTRDDRDFELLRRARVTVRWWTKPPVAVTNAPPPTPAAPVAPLQ